MALAATAPAHRRKGLIKAAAGSGGYDYYKGVKTYLSQILSLAFNPASPTARKKLKAGAMTAHTPGPWEANSISMENGDIGVSAPDLRISICHVHNAASFGDMLAGAMKRGGGSFDGRDAKTQFANARLIARAPELYEILRAVNHTLACHGKIDADTDLHSRVRDAIQYIINGHQRIADSQ